MKFVVNAPKPDCCSEVSRMCHNCVQLAEAQLRRQREPAFNADETLPAFPTIEELERYEREKGVKYDWLGEPQPGEPGYEARVKEQALMQKYVAEHAERQRQAIERNRLAFGGSVISNARSPEFNKNDTIYGPDGPDAL